MKKIIFYIPLFLIGCSSPNYDMTTFDTISNSTTPSKNKAGIFVYRDPVIFGIVGNLYKAEFKLSGYQSIPIETSEFFYFEIDPGEYQYQQKEKMDDSYLSFNAVANHNYYINATCFQSCSFKLENSQKHIDAAKKMIFSGELNKKDIYLQKEGT